MAAITQSTGDHLVADRPFDVVLSRTLDAIQIELDAQPAAPRRWWLRAKKRVYERKIPDVLRASAAVLAAIDLCANCRQEPAFPDIDSFALCEDCRARGVR
jgi:hypothetical protein